jgi:peptide/nickel transport system permease protein
LGDVLRDFYDPYHTIFFRIPWPWKKKGPAAAAEALPPQTAPLPQAAVPASAADAETVPLTPDAPPQAAPPLLEVRDLRVRFSLLRGSELLPVQAVRGVSFRVYPGEALGIVGESGSGKSVSTQAIPGLLPKNAAAEGSIRYGGTELLGLSAEELRRYRGRKIGMIFQEPGRSYDPLQNMRKVFLETFRNSEPGIPKEEADRKAEAILAEVGLDRGGERLSNFPHQFSGGQLQRIGIALALAQGCELLVADEPTTALDVTIQKQIMELLKSLRKSRGLSIIFISHDIDLVADISDRIIVMYGGLVMESGPGGLITGSPAHPYTQALLAASPGFGSHYRGGPLRSIPGRVADPVHPEPGCPFAPRCSRAGEDCRGTIPPLTRRGEGHEVRCIR